MEDSRKKKIPPSWWVKVINDLERASLAAQRSFKTPNTVVGITEDSEGETTGYLIRHQSGGIVYYTASEVKHALPVGAKLKNDLPEPEYEVEGLPEVTIESYAFEVIRENINLIPRLWLRSVLGKILQGKPITMKEDLKAFPAWVLLPADKKDDKTLIDLLYRATRYEGLKGLKRYNDLH